MASRRGGQSRLVDRARGFVEEHTLRVGVDEERGPPISGFQNPHAFFSVAPVFDDNVNSVPRKNSSTTAFMRRR